MNEQRFLDQNGVLFLWSKVKELVEEATENLSNANGGLTEDQISEILIAAEEAKTAAVEAKAASDVVNKLLSNGNLTEEDYQYYTNVLTIYELPVVGKANILYIVTSTKESYIWDEENHKYELIPYSDGDAPDIDIINGGNA